MPISDETRKQSLEVLRKHAAELGISQQFEDAVNMPPQQIAEIYNSEIVKGQYGIDVPTPTVNTKEELDAFMSKFLDLPIPGTVPDAQLKTAVEGKKGLLASGGLSKLSGLKKKI
jgi:hypothetical protein